MKTKLLLTDDMTRSFSLLLDKVTCNPRGMKRIANLLQIIVALGRIKPRDKYISLLPIAQADPKVWNKFTEKCVHWIFLCENFPFRMSTLVQVILDFEQKREFNSNANACKRRMGKKSKSNPTTASPFDTENRNDSGETDAPIIPTSPSDSENRDDSGETDAPNIFSGLSDSENRDYSGETDAPNIPTSPSGSENRDDSGVTDAPIISYARSVKTGGVDVEIIDTDELSIFEFYMNHVEKYIPVFTKAEKFSRSDRDPEEFACLLQKTAAITDGEILITCKDVLGPKIENTGRDSMLSLLSYSFNLDPAMRIEVFITISFMIDNCYNFVSPDRRGNNCCGLRIRVAQDRRNFCSADYFSIGVYSSQTFHRDFQ